MSNTNVLSHGLIGMRSFNQDITSHFRSSFSQINVQQIGFIHNESVMSFICLTTMTLLPTILEKTTTERI